MASISIRVNSNDKSMFEEFCDSVGMNISTAFNLYIKNVIANQKLPFSIERDPFYSEENQKYLMKSIKQFKDGKCKKHDLIEV